MIAILVKLDSEGPVLYVSERIGRDGKRFRFLKFRTMVKDADSLRGALLHLNERRGNLFKMSNDPRVTRLGRLCGATVWTSCRSSSACLPGT